MKPLTTTSYAILGLLAIKPWTTYELAKQMEASLRNFWPRAERKLYEEPRKLVAHKLATVQHETVGKRPRSVYRITPAGQRALRAWLDEPGELVSLEFEALIKVFFAEHGGKDQLLANLDRIHAGALARVAVDAQWAQHYLTTGGQFPQRLALISLVGTLQAQLNQTILAWASWARQIARTWPEDLRTAPPARAELEKIAHLANHN
ncbi:MAG TPA: PadR family transcriptional regulator [Pseudonocardiaceae bacterium]|nr:PadR family transcriptional regulator [Pseudonocardiaceae bacterium]